MPKRVINELLQQRRLRLEERERELEAFIEGWDWPCVYEEWSRRIKSFNVALEPLFLVVNVHDPKHPTGRSPEVSWWPANEIHELRANCQRHFDRWPGTRGSPHPNSTQLNQGQIDTVRYLAKCHSDLETVAAVLIAASLFSRLHARRAGYPERWPKAHCVAHLDRLAREKWNGAGEAGAWHPMSTDVLPVTSEDDVYKIDTMAGLVRYLAEEHASTLLSFRAVEVRFADAPDPFVVRVLGEEREAERRQLDELATRQKRADEKERARAADLRKVHPRWGEFNRLTKAELMTLVWSKPTTQIAKEFGVSDVAIGKRCKIQFIPKPPPGFWRRVEAGHIPNPAGTPVRQ